MTTRHCPTPFCPNRLSAANARICDSCADEQARFGGLAAACAGGCGAAVKADGLKCKRCRRRVYTAKPNQRRTDTKPCAKCGGGPRQPGTAYCRPCRVKLTRAWAVKHRQQQGVGAW